MRPSGRELDQIRTITMTKHYTKHAEGSVLIECGDTQVICTATVEERVPSFLRNQGKGWVTAEYGMLPRSTSNRMRREANSGKQGGRTMEIQRLIGRSLRACVDTEKLGERTITLDCDVIQADGGTRTASISGAYVALVLAVNQLIADGKLKESPMTSQIAAISVGIYQSKPVLDLDYDEDCSAETDMNIVMNSDGGFIEIQGTAEGAAFSGDELNSLLELGRKGTSEIFAIQNAVVAA